MNKYNLRLTNQEEKDLLIFPDCTFEEAVDIGKIYPLHDAQIINTTDNTTQSRKGIRK